MPTVLARTRGADQAHSIADRCSGTDQSTEHLDSPFDATRGAQWKTAERTLKPARTMLVEQRGIDTRDYRISERLVAAFLANRARRTRPNQNSVTLAPEMLAQATAVIVIVLPLPRLKTQEPLTVDLVARNAAAFANLL